MDPQRVECWHYSRMFEYYHVLTPSAMARSPLAAATVWPVTDSRRTYTPLTKYHPRLSIPDIYPPDASAFVKQSYV